MLDCFVSTHISECQTEAEQTSLLVHDVITQLLTTNIIFLTFNLLFKKNIQLKFILSFSDSLSILF